MRYNIKENYGQRAYIGLEEFKKNGLNKKETDATISKKLKFRVIDASNLINKKIVINSNNTLANVKIYSKGDNKFGITIINNDIVVYKTNAPVNMISTSIFMVEINKLEFVFENESDSNFDIVVELEGEFLNIFTNLRIDRIGTKYYKAESGFGESVVTEFDTVEDLEINNYSTSYNIPITLLDMKRVTDSEIGGESIVILGIDDEKKLCYKNLTTNSEFIVVSSKKTKDACLINYLDFYIVIVYILENKIYITLKVNEENIVKEIKLPIFTLPCRLVSAIRDSQSIKEDIVFAVLLKSGSFYACVESYFNTQNFKYRLIGLGKHLNISRLDSKFNAYILDEISTSKKEISFNKDKQIVSVVNEGNIYPLDEIFEFSDISIYLYNNCLTVVKK